MKQGSSISSKTRRVVCDEAKGASSDYVASVVYHNSPVSKRWVDKITKIEPRITDEQYLELNDFLGLEENDAIFIGTKPETFTVVTLKMELMIGRINDPWKGKTASN